MVFYYVVPWELQVHARYPWHGYAHLGYVRCLPRSPLDPTSVLGEALTCSDRKLVCSMGEGLDPERQPKYVPCSHEHKLIGYPSRITHLKARVSDPPWDGCVDEPDGAFQDGMMASSGSS